MIYVSLGPNCHPAGNLKHLKFRDNSLPFDWLLMESHLGIKYVNDNINKNFSLFTKELDSKKNKVFSKNYPETLFFHHNLIKDPSLIETFNRRGQKFIDLISDESNSIIFLYMLELDVYNNKEKFDIFLQSIKEFENNEKIKAEFKLIIYINNDNTQYELILYPEINSLHHTFFLKYIRNKSINKIYGDKNDFKKLLDEINNKKHLDFSYENLFKKFVDLDKIDNKNNLLLKNIDLSHSSNIINKLQNSKNLGISLNLNTNENKINIQLHKNPENKLDVQSEINFEPKKEKCKPEENVVDNQIEKNIILKEEDNNFVEFFSEKIIVLKEENIIDVQLNKNPDNKMDIQLEKNKNPENKIDIQLEKNKNPDNKIDIQLEKNKNPENKINIQLEKIKNPDNKIDIQLNKKAEIKIDNIEEETIDIIEKNIEFKSNKSTLIIKPNGSLFKRIKIIFSILGNGICKRLIVVWEVNNDCKGYYLDYFEPIRQITFVKESNFINFELDNALKVENINKYIRFLKKLKLNPNMQNELDNMLNKNLPKKYYALHFRNTGYFKNNNFKPFSKFIQSNLNNMIYIATDNKESQDILLKIPHTTTYNYFNGSIEDIIIDFFICINSTEFIGTEGSHFTEFVKVFRSINKI